LIDVVGNAVKLFTFPMSGGALDVNAGEILHRLAGEKMHQ
jgi:hypothetical protein